MMSDSIAFRTPQVSPRRSQDATFAAMRRAFQKAFEARPAETVTTDFVLAGAQVHWRVAGRRLAEQMMRPFRHLCVSADGSPAQLAIDLWDEHSTGIACPYGEADLGEGDLAADGPDPCVTVGTAENRYVGHLRPAIQVWMDREAAHVIGRAASGEQLSIQDRGKPLHFPLLLWHADRGVPVIHAALVSHRGRGALLVGKGGTGKTTAALTCLAGGLDFLADDYVGLERAAEGVFIGHSLYDSAWLAAESEAHFPTLASYASPADRLVAGAKRLLHLFDAADDRLQRSARIGAVMIPVLSDEPRSSIRPATKSTALLALAPSSALRLPVSGTDLLERTSQLVEHVASFTLRIGRDRDRLPALVRKLLDNGGTR
jgi:TM2 domain-containing membrane protein YozV